MRFFTDLGACCGGAIVSPATEAADDGTQRQVAVPRMFSINNRLATLVRSKNSKKHFKPVLSAISEDNVFSDVDTNSQQTVRSGKKSLRKKSKVKAPRPTYDDHFDHRRSSHPMALPAFAPTPFLF